MRRISRCSTEAEEALLLLTYSSSTAIVLQLTAHVNQAETDLFLPEYQLRTKSTIEPLKKRWLDLTKGWKTQKSVVHAVRVSIEKDSRAKVSTANKSSNASKKTKRIVSLIAYKAMSKQAVDCRKEKKDARNSWWTRQTRRSRRVWIKGWGQPRCDVSLKPKDSKKSLKSSNDHPQKISTSNNPNSLKGCSWSWDGSRVCCSVRSVRKSLGLRNGLTG